MFLLFFVLVFFFLEKGIPLCREIDNKATANSNHKIRLLYRLQRKQLTKSYRRNLQLPPITGTKYTESTLLLVDYHNDRKFTLWCSDCIKSRRFKSDHATKQTKTRAGIPHIVSWVAVGANILLLRRTVYSRCFHMPTQGISFKDTKNLWWKEEYYKCLSVFFFSLFCLMTAFGN